MKAILMAAMLVIAFPAGAADFPLIGPDHPVAGRWVGNGEGNPFNVHDALTFFCDVGTMPGMEPEGRYSDYGPNFYCVGISRDKDPADGRALGTPRYWEGYLYEVAPGYYAVSWDDAIPLTTLIIVLADSDFQTLSTRTFLNSEGAAENSTEASILFRPHKGFDPGMVYNFLTEYER